MELLKKLQSTKLTTENLSPTRNIERVYQEVFFTIFGRDIKKDSQEGKEVKNKMQLFLLAYALGKINNWDDFACIQKKLIDELELIKGEDRLKKQTPEKKFSKIIKILLGKVFQELQGDNSIGILENIVGVDYVSLLAGKEVNGCSNNDKEKVLFGSIGKYKGNVEQLLESDNFKNARNQPEFLVENGISYKRGIEVYYEKIIDKCFTQEQRENSDAIAKKMQSFNIAYILCKYKFQNSKRSSGERYFDHLLSVVDLYLDNENYPTFDGVMIALLHDIIEDSDIDDETLDYLFGEKIAKGVNNLSKTSVREYLAEGSVEEAFFVENIKEGFLNAKGLVSDQIRGKKNNNIWDEKEKDLYVGYKRIHKKYKRQRNKDYFQEFLKRGLAQNGHDLAIDEQVKIKCYDRIHNTQTLLGFGIQNIEKILQKIDETIDYFFPITEKKFPEIHSILSREVENILMQLQDRGERISQNNNRKITNQLSKMRGFFSTGKKVHNIIS